MSQSTLYTALIWIVPLVIAIVFHEVAHGKVAHLLGDPTAAERGRLSLNPIRHIDPFGTIILPLILALSGAPVFGWAKPVPVVPQRMRNPRWGMVVTAAAGPATNFVLALVSTIGFALTADKLPWLAAVFGASVMVNIFLGVFNLLPLPPFDGSKVLGGFLPPPLDTAYARLDRYALLIFIALLLVLPRIDPRLDVIAQLVNPPVDWLLTHLRALAQWLVGGA